MSPKNCYPSTKNLGVYSRIPKEFMNGTKANSIVILQCIYYSHYKVYVYKRK